MMPHRLVGILFLLLVLATNVQAQGEVVLRINGTPVPLSTFEHYYRKRMKQTPEAFMQSFILYQLKVRYACDAGWDTLPDFRRQLSYYQNQLLKAYATDTLRREGELRRMYERRRARLQENDWIRVAHISKYLPQQVERNVEIAAQEQMDTVYAALQQGADFALLAQQYSDDVESRQEGGLLPWMPVDRYVQEWIDKLALLGQNEPSLPFYSPFGIHIVKWVERPPYMGFEGMKEQIAAYWERQEGSAAAFGMLSDEKKQQLAHAMEELHDGLLAAYVTEKHQPVQPSYQEADLVRFFKQHKADYAWNLPHYRGAVIHCRNKKEAAAIKKYLKKYPMSVWEEALSRLSLSSPAPRMEVGVFQIGKNKYVDKLVFKCGDFQADAQWPYVFVVGKKLKKGPESYKDVQEQVIRDYSLLHEDAWLKELKRKYKVEINQEVLKTVNNNGSN